MALVVFRSRLRPEHAPEFMELAEDLLEQAQAMPGFVSYKSFKSEDDERCSIIEFESAEQLRAWREKLEHRDAQQLGRKKFYQEYSLWVGEPVRQSQFEA